MSGPIRCRQSPQGGEPLDDFAQAPFCPRCADVEHLEIQDDVIVCHACHARTNVGEIASFFEQRQASKENGAPRKPLPRRIDSALRSASQSEKPTEPRPRRRRERPLADDPRLIAAARDLGEPIKLGDDVHRIVDDCAGVLSRCSEIFARSGDLVPVVRDAAPPPGITRPADAPSIRTVPQATLLEQLTRVTMFVKFDKRSGSLVQSLPSSTVLAALAARGSWSGVRQLRGILEAPALRPDGTVIQESGYDAATGFLFVPSHPFPAVASKPTRADALRARDELLEVVADFPFASDAHRAAWLAFVLTLFARPAIDGCVPLVAIDATAPGTGKGRLVDATAIIATGREGTKTPLPQDDEECRKRITSLLIEGERLAVLDNISDTIALPSLDAALTATVWRDRLLGKNASVTVPNLMLWAATGNNLAIGGDLARRTLHIRLESRIEDPENRADFRHPDLLAWVRAERPRLACAALTILRAHAVAGSPRCGVKAWGSFESFSARVAAAVAWVDLPDPQTTRDGLAIAADATKNALATLIDGWARLTVTTPEGVTAKALLARLYTAERLRGFAVPDDGFDDVREAIEMLVPTPHGRAPSPIRLAGRIRAARRRVIGGRMFDEGIPDRTKSMRWLIRTTGAGDAGNGGIITNPSREESRDKYIDTGGNNHRDAGNPRAVSGAANVHVRAPGSEAPYSKWPETKGVA